MSSQQVARSTGVPNDFYRFVHFIETRQSTPVRVSFTTNEELKVCAKYFIERAIKHPHLMKQFAEGVKRIFFVTPFYVDKDSNFKREILHETQNQINELLRAPSGWTVERAESVVKFFGEIYNIGFIFPWILKKFLDVFKSNSGRSLTATCYKVLLETVKSEVPKLTLNDDTEVGKMLRQMVQEFEKTRLENSKNENLKIEAAKLSQLKIILPPTTLHSIIAKLNAENSKEILKKIADFKTDDTWQSCYELLIERALSAPELAESILLICKKIPDNRNESWSKIKVDDYKKLITRMIVDKFNELFDNASSGSAATQVFRIVNLIQKLREASMCSIGCVASLLDVMIDCAEKDMNLAATILVKLVRIFRNGISAEKIKKIPLEKREKILTILLDCESSASSKADLKRIAEYLSVDFTDNSSEVSIDESLIEDFGRNGTGIMLNGADGSSTLQAKMSSKSSTTSSASGWNGFSQKFPSFTEAVDIQQQLRQAHQDSFESLIDKMTAENSDQILSKIDDSLAIPEGEAPYETLLDKLRFSPELLEPIVDVIKKILSCQPGTSKTSEFDKKSTFMCQIIHHKLEISLNSFDNKSSDNQVLTVIKLVQRLYENSLITKHFINNVIESVRIYENDNNLKISGSAVFKKIATNLEKFRDKQMSSNDRNNSEMTSSGDWSDFDSGILTSCMKRSSASPSTPSSSKPGSPLNTSINNKSSAILKTFQSFNLKDLKRCADKMAALNIQTREDLKYFTELIVSVVRSSKSLVPSYAKLLSHLSDLSVMTELRLTTLKALIPETCFGSLMKLLAAKIDDSSAVELNSLVEFIAELFNLQVIDASCVELCMKELLTRETSCCFCVHGIDVLMRIIGSRKSQNNDKLLGKYFNFFEHAVATDSISFRTTTYKSLIEFRNSGWSSPKTVSNFFQFQASMVKSATVSELLQDLETSGRFQSGEGSQQKARAVDSGFNESVEQQEPIEGLKAQLKPLRMLEESNEQLQQAIVEDTEPVQPFEDAENAVFIYLSDLELAADKLRKLLSSSSRIEKFVVALTKQISLDSRKTSSYAKLCKKLSEITVDFGSTFKEILNENIFKMFAGFVCKQNLDVSAMKSFENVLIMAAELYRNDAFSNDDLSIFLQNKYSKKISLVCLMEISAIISLKIISNGDRAMMRLLNDLEEMIEDESVKSFSTLKVEIKHLAISIDKIMTKN